MEVWEVGGVFSSSRSSLIQRSEELGDLVVWVLFFLGGTHNDHGATGQDVK